MVAALLRNTWRPLAVAAAVAFLYWGVLMKLAGQWWTDENYSHGLLIPFVILYILWSERERLARVAPSPSLIWGGVLVGCALLTLLAGTLGAEIYLQRTSLVLLLTGLVLYFRGWRMLRYVFVPLLLLALAIPVPTIIFNKVAFPLQLFASRFAVWTMRVFNILVMRDSNVI